MALIRRTNSTTTPIPPNIEKGTTYGGIGTIIGTSKKDSTKKEDDNSSSSYADVITSGSEGSMVRNGSASNGSDGTGEGSALTQDQYVERYKKARQEFGVAGEDGKNKDEFRTPPPTLGNSNVEGKNGKVTSRETSENGNVLTNVNRPKFPEFRINPRLESKGNAHANDGDEVYVQKPKGERTADDIYRDYKYQSDENTRNINEAIDASTALVNKFKKDEEDRRAKYERGERRASALDNVMRGFEMLFNGHNVRHGGLNVKGADDVRKEDKNERFAKYQKDREELRQQYEKASQSNRSLIDKLQRKANSDSNDYKNEVSNYYKQREDSRKEEAAKDTHDVRQSQIGVNNARENSINTNASNSARVADSRVDANEALANQRNAKASNDVNTGSGNNTNTGNEGAVPNGMKHYSGGKYDYWIPTSTDAKAMRSEIIRALGIDTAIYKTSDSGYTYKDRDKTAAEIDAEISAKWNSKAGDVVRRYGGRKKDSGGSQTSSSSGNTTATANNPASSNGTKPSTASGGAKPASNGTKASGNSGSSKDKKDVAGGGTGIWGNSINRGKKKKQQTK